MMALVAKHLFLFVAGKLAGPRSSAISAALRGPLAA